MYERIRQRPPLHDVYAQRLIDEGIPAKEIEQQAETIQQRLEKALETEPQPQQVGFGAKWEDIQREYVMEQPDTSVQEETLSRLAERLSTIPESFNAHRKIAKLLEKDPSSRYQSGKELAADLKAWQASPEGEAASAREGG